MFMISVQALQASPDRTGTWQGNVSGALSRPRPATIHPEVAR